MSTFLKIKNKGEISLAAAVVGALAMIIGSSLTAWATASGRVGAIDTKVEVIAERENNHYKEVQATLSRIEKKLDDRALEIKSITTGPAIQVQ